MGIVDRIKKKKYSIIILLLLCVIILILVDRHLFTMVTVRGASMEPSISCGDKVVVLASRFAQEDLKTGDIVVFKSPECLDELFIKRVIATEGQTFCITSGDLIIDGKSHCEEYTEECEYILRAYKKTCGTVPEGKLYLLGDSRNSSNDSRTYGYISEG